MAAPTITTAPATVTDVLHDVVRRQQDRKLLLDRHMREYARRGFAICLTDGIEGDAAKRVTGKGWDKTEPLGDPGYAAGVYSNRCLTRNPALVLGPSGLIALDVDDEDGRQKLREFGPLPSTVIVVTGKGWHLYFRPPVQTRVTKIQFAREGITLTEGGAYLVCPPALHPSGTTYRFLDGHDPWTTEIAAFPKPLLERLQAEQRSSDEAERHDDDSPIPNGQRHAHFRRLAGAMRRVGAGEAEITAALLALNARRCIEPKPEHLVRALAKDFVDRYPPGERS
jgi:hypothetical protein